MSSKDLLAAIGGLRRIMDDLHQVSKRVDDERKRDLVRLRRELSEQLPLIQAAAASAEPFASDPDSADQLRQRLSAARSAIAMHQAAWPAVSISDGGAAYKESAAKVRQSNEQFLDWIQSVLADPRGRAGQSRQGDDNR